MTDDSDQTGGSPVDFRVTGEGVEIAVSQPSRRWRAQELDVVLLCREAVRGALAATESREVGMELSVVLGDDAMVRRLNRKHRGQDTPTNVLAFPGDSPEAAVPDGAPRLLGDVILAYETVAREASQQDKLFEDHLRHLVVHGALHLMGFDHETDVEAHAMELLEIAVLARIGVPNPYACAEERVGEPS